MADHLSLDCQDSAMSAPTALRPRSSTSPLLAWTVADVDRAHDRADRLVGRFGGILVGRMMGLEEPHLTKRKSWFLGHFIDDHGRGIVEGKAGVVPLAV